MQKKAVTPVQPKAVPPAKKSRRYGYEFYRDNFRRMTVFALGLVIADLVLVAALYLVYTHFPQRDLYATTRNGLLVKLRQFNSLNQVMAAKARKPAAKEAVESANP